LPPAHPRLETQPKRFAPSPPTRIEWLGHRALYGHLSQGQPRLPVEKCDNAPILLWIAAVVRAPVWKDGGLIGDPQRLAGPPHQQQKRGERTARLVAIGVSHVCRPVCAMTGHLTKRRQRLGKPPCPHVQIRKLEPRVPVPGKATLGSLHQEALRLVESEDGPRGLRVVAEVNRGRRTKVGGPILDCVLTHFVALLVVARFELDRAQCVLGSFDLIGVSGSQPLLGSEACFFELALLHERPGELGPKLRRVELVVAVHERQLLVVVLEVAMRACQPKAGAAGLPWLRTILARVPHGRAPSGNWLRHSVEPFPRRDGRRRSPDAPPDSAPRHRAF